MSGTHEHLEHAEHAGHGQDAFTIRVAMTMAIIAALLAAVSLIGHRKHNEALQKQGDSNRLKTESAEYEVKSSNIFAWYQSKCARVEQAKNSITMTELLAPAPNSDAQRAKAIQEWKDYIRKNDTKKDAIKVDSEGMPPEKDDTLAALIIRGDKFKEMAAEKTKEAHKAREEFHHAHHQADGLDWAHLATELGLVLCTICVLTKQRGFWLAGIAAALGGVALAGYALFLIH